MADDGQVGIGSASDASPDGGALGLLRIPFVFSQDKLLKSEQFVAFAKDCGVELSLDDLQALHELRLLVPLFWVSDDEDSARIFARQTGDEGLWAYWAETGQLHDSGLETWANEGPYRMPADAPREWWDGYYYSPWHVLNLAAALGARGVIEWGADADPFVNAAEEARSVVLVLAALAPRHYARVWGRASLPAGRSWDEFHDAEYEIGEAQRLQVAGFRKERLVPEAETLLLRARGNDPLDELWPLLRHGTHLTWERLHGPARLAVEQRVAAEILLRAHEQLAFDGEIEPLPKLTGMMRQPRHDRITDRDGSADSLHRALARFGLSPQPRVLVVVEGETEEIHLARLLEEHGLERSNQIRLHVLGTSSVSPSLLANYAVTPRMGKIHGDRHTVDGVVTGHFVAMDPENKYAPSRIADTTRKLRVAVRRAVERQGAAISDEELDTLVHVRVWGTKSYELANFSDAQLIAAIEKLGDERGFGFGGDRTGWRERSRLALAIVRASEEVVDIEHVRGGFGFPLAKPRLAELLLPNLMEALHEGDQELPVLKVMHDLRDLHARLSGTGFSLAASQLKTD